MTTIRTYQTIRFEISGNTGHILLNRPPSNSMNVAFFEELAELTDILQKDKPVKAIVISGAGRHFSSGASVDELINITGSSENYEEFFVSNIRSFNYFASADIPVIAAIRGVCIGSAMELALFAHFRFCSEDALFGLPESTFGLMPGIGGVSHLSAIAGKAETIRLVLRGNTFMAKEAAEMGIADRIFHKKEVLNESFTFAEAISQNYHRTKKDLYLKRYYGS